MKNSEILEIIDFAEKMLHAHSIEDFVGKAEAKIGARQLRIAYKELKSSEGTIQAILSEVERATEKHPNTDMPLADWVAVLAEESGELTRASLQYKYEGGLLEEIRKEAIQTGATCIRLLNWLSESECPDKYVKENEPIVLSFEKRYEAIVDDWGRLRLSDDMGYLEEFGGRRHFKTHTRADGQSFIKDQGREINFRTIAKPISFDRGHSVLLHGVPFNSLALVSDCFDYVRLQGNKVCKITYDDPMRASISFCGKQIDFGRDNIRKGVGNG